MNFIIFVYLISEEQLEENLRMERNYGSKRKIIFSPGFSSRAQVYELNLSSWILPPKPLNLKFEITYQFEILEEIRYIRIETLLPFLKKPGFPNVHTF